MSPADKQEQFRLNVIETRRELLGSHSERPTTLYHYTSVPAMFSILEPKAERNNCIYLWASSPFCMNDASECATV
jgi:hypothetical protein